MANPECTDRVKADKSSSNLAYRLMMSNESASFIRIFRADSLDIVELVMALEEEYDIEISDEDAREIKLLAMRLLI